MNRLLLNSFVLVTVCLSIATMCHADDFQPNADYFLEIFTTKTPFNEGAEHPGASKIFSNRDDIYLVARYYTKISGTVSHILIVTNSAGQIVDLSSYEIFRDVNPHSFYFKKSYPSGSYNFNMFIAGPGGAVMSPNSYSFVVTE